MKILLCLQFFAGDRERAYKLARFIHRMQRGVSETADFLFTWRYDAEHDPAMTALMQEKFKVLTHKSRIQERGWPDGSNAVWCDLIGRLGERGGLGYKAVLTFEGDCVPISTDWIEKLSAEFDRKKKYSVGHISPCKGPGEVMQQHLNGNALYSCNPQFLKAVSNLGCPTRWGHDVLFAKTLEQLGWANTPLIQNLWRSSAFDNERLESLQEQGTVFVHGCKDDSLINLVDSQIVPP